MTTDPKPPENKPRNLDDPFVIFSDPRPGDRFEYCDSERVIVLRNEQFRVLGSAYNPDFVQGANLSWYLANKQGVTNIRPVPNPAEKPEGERPPAARVWRSGNVCWVHGRTPGGELWDDKGICNVFRVASIEQLKGDEELSPAEAEKWCEEHPMPIHKAVSMPKDRRHMIDKANEVDDGCISAGIHSPDAPGKLDLSAVKKSPALTFAEFSRINAIRSARWASGQTFTLEFHGDELAEECGEVFGAFAKLAEKVGSVCGAVKKMARLRMGVAGGKDMTENLREELADVVIVADLIAGHVGINLGEAIASKFNATSAKHGFPDRLPTTPTQEKPCQPQSPSLPSSSQQPLDSSKDSVSVAKEAAQMDISKDTGMAKVTTNAPADDAWAMEKAREILAKVFAFLPANRRVEVVAAALIKARKDGEKSAWPIMTAVRERDAALAKVQELESKISDAVYSRHGANGMCCQLWENAEAWGKGLEEKLNLAQDFGVDFGMMKEAGKEPRLVIVPKKGTPFARQSQTELDLISANIDKETLHRENEKLAVENAAMRSILEEDLYDQECTRNTDQGPHDDCECWYCRTHKTMATPSPLVADFIACREGIEHWRNNPTDVLLTDDDQFVAVGYGTDPCDDPLAAILSGKGKV